MHQIYAQQNTLHQFKKSNKCHLSLASSVGTPVELTTHHYDFIVDLLSVNISWRVFSDCSFHSIKGTKPTLTR